MTRSFLTTHPLANLLLARAVQPGAATPIAAPGVLRQPGTRRAVRFYSEAGISTSINLGGTQCRFVSGAPLKPSKQSKRRLTDRLNPLLWFVAVHGPNHDGVFLKCLTKLLTRVSA